MMVMSTMVFAQHHKADPKAIATRTTDRMKKALLLNDDQYAKVKAVNEKFIESSLQVRRDTALTQGIARNQQKQLRTDHQSQLKQILTDEQWSKWSTMKSKRMQDRRQHGGGKTDKG